MSRKRHGDLVAPRRRDAAQWSCMKCRGCHETMDESRGCFETMDEMLWLLEDHE